MDVENSTVGSPKHVLSALPQSDNNLVFIFKASADGKGDKYEKILTANKIPTFIIPVLAFDFVNVDELASHLRSQGQLGAIIFTSTRAVQAVGSVIKELNDAVKGPLHLVQCFVVGPATYEAAVDLGFRPEGEESGNGDALAKYILQHLKNSSKRLLLPCSNLHKDELPNILQQEGLKVAEVVCYETHPDEHITERIRLVVEAQGIPEFVVFFSPSGFNTVHDSAPSLPFSLPHTKIIALGPTTASVVTNKGYKLHGVTKKPDPESLLTLLKKGRSSSPS